MTGIKYIHRKSKKKLTEKVYGERWIQLLYSNSPLFKILGLCFRTIFAKNALFSSVFGFFQKRAFSKRKVKPFIKKYEVDSKEFRDPVESFSSFNDFFIRKLKSSARPVCQDKNSLIAPADGRYLFAQEIGMFQRFFAKKKSFDLGEFLNSSEQAKKYDCGAFVLIRLCPLDYHRFHFPVAGVPSESKLINGSLFSVNPLALNFSPSIFWENKRVITQIQSRVFGQVLMCEIGATNVGSIQQTFVPNSQVLKGDEKGFFEFGGSSIILLFEKGYLTIDPDLIQNSKGALETYCQMGDSIGRHL